jgi:hypothetical protein
MSFARRVVDVCVRLVPAEHRERYREEWHSDLDHCAELGLPPRAITIGAIRVVATTPRGPRSMYTRMRLTPLRTTALVLLGLISVFWILLFVPNLIVAGLAAVAMVVKGLPALNRRANEVADRLGSQRLPWILYAAVTTTGAVGIISLFEIGLMFEATDRGETTGVPTLVFVATGFAGVGAVVAMFGTALAILLELGKTPKIA